ncbi:MAG: hydrogenase iron-sulfur subunit [Deltaproteobacteria bacterium]|nr:hydrogenase iron-sulfur subunit [Deltaproteobacteria bacterium]
MSGEAKGEEPKILVFSTNNISDPGIDLAGSAHMHYPPGVVTIPIPCSSGIKPSWIIHALESGFDGVFIAADGTDCAYVPDCTDRTGKVIQRSQDMMTERGMDPRRLKMAAICSVCAEAFTSHLEKFSDALSKLGGQGEG